MAVIQIPTERVAAKERELEERKLEERVLQDEDRYGNPRTA
jgi:hypothetical protein